MGIDVAKVKSELREWAEVVVGVPVIIVLAIGDMLFTLARGTTADKSSGPPAGRSHPAPSNDP